MGFQMYDLAVAGDLESIELTLEAVRVKLSKRSYKLSRAVAVRADRDDVVQVTLVRVYKAFTDGSLQGVTEPEFWAWVGRQARNVARDFSKTATYAKRDVRQEASREAIDGPIDVQAYEPEAIDAMVDREIVSELFAMVKRDDDKAILLGIMEGLSYADIASGLGVQVDRIYWRVKYLRNVSRRVAV